MKSVVQNRTEKQREEVVLSYSIVLSVPVLLLVPSCLCTCPPVCLSVCLSFVICVSLCPSIHTSSHPAIYIVLWTAYPVCAPCTQYKLHQRICLCKPVFPDMRHSGKWYQRCRLHRYFCPVDDGCLFRRRVGKQLLESSKARAVTQTVVRNDFFAFFAVYSHLCVCGCLVFHTCQCVCKVQAAVLTVVALGGTVPLLMALSRCIQYAQTSQA
jgi:hypothetical protein